MARMVNTNEDPFDAEKVAVWGIRKGRRDRSRLCATVFGLLVLAIASALLGLSGILASLILGGVPYLREFEPFYYSVNTHDNLCVGGRSHSGYVGLKGDSEDTPKRSFFWCASALDHTRPTTCHADQRSCKGTSKRKTTMKMLLSCMCGRPSVRFTSS